MELFIDLLPFRVRILGLSVSLFATFTAILVAALGIGVVNFLKFFSVWHLYLAVVRTGDRHPRPRFLDIRGPIDFDLPDDELLIIIECAAPESRVFQFEFAAYLLDLLLRSFTLCVRQLVRPVPHIDVTGRQGLRVDRRRDLLFLFLIFALETVRAALLLY